MQPKQYQLDCIAALTRYFKKTVEIQNAQTAFVIETGRPYHEVPQLPGMPYVCLRVPTGGGKTILASHAVGLAARHLMQSTQCVCLWLVPSNPIKDQTLTALRDKDHPYYQALATYFGGDITVMDRTEALSITTEATSDSTVIIVSTLGGLRVEDVDGRKVYDQAGALKPHFEGLLPEQVASLEKWPNGEPVKSLANLLRLHRPVVIVDEAHNARTALSFETLQRFAPSCIVEFTATPQLADVPAEGKLASNVLHHVSAAELKAADMIKLPLRVFTHADWKEVLARTIDAQRNLERLATREETETGEYIRPIALIQAQSQSQQRQTLTAEAIRRALVDDFHIPEAEIAVATGTTREIENVDLFEKTCPIRFIITVQALREGWDCSFAYILCSVTESHSSRSIEQLVGRILRMPRAMRKHNEELNSSYAFSASPQFEPVIRSLQDALVENGFQRLEARQLVAPVVQPALLGTGPLFKKQSVVVPKAPTIDRLPTTLKERLTFDPSSHTLTVTGYVSPEDIARLKTCFDDEASKTAVDALQPDVTSQEERERTRPFSVPWLVVRQQGELDIFDETAYSEVPWDLGECDARLSEKEFSAAPLAGQSAEVDVSDQGRITSRFVGELQNQLALLEVQQDWTMANLLVWLDHRIPHPDIPQFQSETFLRNALRHLLDVRKVPLALLGRYKFVLADALEAKIREHRGSHKATAFQDFLFGGLSSQIEVDPALNFTFTEDKYAANSYYEGAFEFQKHYFPVVGELESKGEEHDCAIFIDRAEAVRYWIRNIARRPMTSFWLQTSTDKFYPDFILLLHDGRIAVVEYKGGNAWDAPDAIEKRDIGGVWAEKSGGRCLFIMPKGRDLNEITVALGSPDARASVSV